MTNFIRRLFQPGSDNRFLPDFLEFMKPIRQAGMMNALGQVVMKIGTPGVPDFYQGTELWNLSLVDPDNRGSVDYDLRRSVLGELVRGEGDRGALVRRLLERPEDGRIKMHVTRSALRFRADRRDLFDRGGYVPLASRGERERHACAFARTAGKRAAIAVIGRFFMSLGAVGGFAAVPGAWGDTVLELPGELSGGGWRDVITGRNIPVQDPETLSLGEVFSLLPVAILEKTA